MSKTINVILNLQDKFSKRMTEAQKNALLFKTRLENCEGAAQKAESFLNGFAATAVSATAAAVAGMTAFAKASVETYGKFQQSMSNVAGILDIEQTSGVYKELEKAAREAGKSTTKTAQESADALSYMALAGWSVEDSINGLMPILRASEATGADLATTSDMITDSMSALGLKTSELEHYLDVCAKAQNNSNTTLTQMQEAYIACGGTFQAFNTDLDESGALLGILANRGIKGSEAGTRLQSTLVNLTKKSGESAEAMEALGISAYDSEGRFKGVTNVLREVREATAGMSEEQRNTYLTMIGGKTQLTTLQALMNGLSNTLEDGSNEFDSLRGKLNDCDGALGRMADTMTNNYAGAMARAGSAVDDLKITIGAKLEPYITRFLNWFSAELPRATEKFALWLDANIPRAIEMCKGAFEKIKPAVTFVINNFKNLAAVAAGVVVGLKAFVVITKVVSLMNTLKTATTAMQAVQLAFNTSLLACPWTWVAVAIGAVVAGVLMWKNAMDEADIEKHFGNITLSAEECGNIVKSLFGRDVVNETEEINAAYSELETTLRSLSDSSGTLDKMNFRLSLDAESVSKEDYIANVNEYMENMNEAIKDEQFVLKANVDLLFGGSDFGTGFMTEINGFYGNMSSECERLGGELREAVENAYEHGWDIDSTEAVAEILKQQAELQQQLATAQSEAKLETLKYDFSAGDLSLESFEMMQEEIHNELANLKDTYDQARIDTIAAAKMMYGEGTDELAKAVEEANKSYNEKIAGLSTTAIQFQNEAIEAAYSDEFAAIKEKMGEYIDGNEILEKISNDLSGDVSQEAMTKAANEFTGQFAAALEQAEISSASKERIASFYEKMMPDVEELGEAMKGMESVPNAYADAFIEANVIGAVGKNSNALYKAGVNSLGRVLPEDKQQILSSAEVLGDAFVQGIQSDGNISGVENAANVLRQRFKNSAERSLSVSIPVNLGTVPNAAYITAPKKTNATGTNYFGGGFTYINEHGGEIIDLPTGSRIYPSDKSEKMMNSSPNVSVNVTVAGNIYGSENAADEIGSAVCARIIDMLNAV